MEKFVYMYIKPGSLWTSVYPNIIINSGPFTCLKWIHLMVLFLFRPTKSVATHNISPRLIQLKQTRKPSPPRALYICSLTIEKHQFVPFSFYQKIYMTAIMFFYSSSREDSTGGSIWIKIGRFTSIGRQSMPPTSFPLWARQRKQLKVSPQCKHV